MEEKIYSRQVNKLSTSLRVVDEHQIKRYFNNSELADLYEFNPADAQERDTPAVPDVRLDTFILAFRTILPCMCLCIDIVESDDKKTIFFPEWFLGKNIFSF